MAVQGVFASNQNIEGSRVGDFASGLLQVHPTGNAPLLALSSGMLSRDAMDTVVSWFEENHLTGRVNVTNNAGTSSTFTIDDITPVLPGQIYYIEETAEVVYIESVSGNDATVTRGLGATNPETLDGSGTPKPIQRIGTAQEEGSGKPIALANLGFPRFNYMQIFRNAWDVTGTARAVQYHTGDIVAKNKADAALFHAEDIERSSIWGVQAIGTLNGKPWRVMSGIREQFSTNLKVQATNTPWTDIRDFLQGIFEQNIKGQPNERIAFCGNTVIQVIDDDARLDSTINISPAQTDFGMKIKHLITPFGDIVLMSHPLFNESPLFTKDLLVLHPGAVEYRYLRRTSEDRNDRDGTRAGIDADFGVFTSEVCINYKAEATGGYYEGIDTPAAS